jgi:hypothetical protein
MTGVSASIPVSIALVEAIAGTGSATALAREIGLTDWSVSHSSDDFRLNARHILTAAGNGLAFWGHEEIAVPVENGADREFKQRFSYHR